MSFKFLTSNMYRDKPVTAIDVKSPQGMFGGPFSERGCNRPVVDGGEGDRVRVVPADGCVALGLVYHLIHS